MNARSISYTEIFDINQPARTLFELFSPEGERLWVPGWQYQNILGTDALHEDYVFLTQGHDHAAGEAIWIVKRYDPDAMQVQYYRIEPGEKLGIVAVSCDSLDRRSTRVTVTYTYIGLSDRGNRFIEGYTRVAYQEFIGQWKSLLEAYFVKKQP